MAASTIPNSGGPGSSIELSPVTIAVRDKVIEKFADQPLDQMNESVKQLLSIEEDEQKRLGILAARVYILRQRISRIAEGDTDRVVGSATPKAHDLIETDSTEATPETRSSEWTRLRILDDCEVNGVRFPKTVIIDVKPEDAEKLIANGNAELIDDNPASSATDADTAADEAAGEIPEMNDGADDGADDGSDDGANTEDEDSALSAALEEKPALKMEVEEPPHPSEEPQDTAGQSTTGQAVIDAPSAAEVTAALEALSGADDDSQTSDANAAAADAPLEMTDVQDGGDDAADVAAELEALSAALAPGGEVAPDVEEADGEAADVAAELEAAAAAMEAGPSNPDTSDLPPAGGEVGSDSDDDDGKPAGWFEAQQNAEASKHDKGKADDEDS